jgi:hypothetical protein
MGRKKMTETLSAKIYQFPAGGRSGSARRELVPPTADQLPPKEGAVASGSGWYHEEAIREEARARAQKLGFPQRQ